MNDRRPTVANSGATSERIPRVSVKDAEGLEVDEEEEEEDAGSTMAHIHRGSK